jgi:Alanine-zipper, major outer membrane lipoprotein
MSTAKGLRLALAGAAALLMLSACVSPDEVADLDRRVGELESRASAAEARASQLDAAADRCTATCQDAQVRAERIYQQSMPR